MKFDHPLGAYIDLPTSDKSVVRTYVVQPESTPRAAVIVLQHMDMRQPGWQGEASRPHGLADSRPGVNPHVRQMAERFAAEGYLAIAPSTFSRGQTGRDYGYRFENARWGWRLMRPLEPLASLDVMLDIEAALTHARRLAPYARIGVVGYCWGGLLAWRAASQFGYLHAAVCHYGGGMDSREDRVRQPLCPVLAHFGSDGRWMAREGVQSFIDAQAALAREGHTTAATQTLVHRAGYGFMQPGHDSFDDGVASEVQLRTLTFLEQHLVATAPTLPA